MEHKPFPPDATKPPESKFPWPLIALAVAVLLLIATLWLTPRTDKAATKAINGSTQPSPQVRGVSQRVAMRDRKSTRLNSSHANISYAVFCLKKKKMMK